MQGDEYEPRVALAGVHIRYERINHHYFLSSFIIYFILSFWSLTSTVHFLTDWFNAVFILLSVQYHQSIQYNVREEDSLFYCALLVIVQSTIKIPTV